MDEFNTIQKAENLFRSVGFVNDTNFIFFSFYDATQQGITAGLVAGGGAIGGMIAGAMMGSDGTENEINKRRDGYLLKWTNEGIGIIPLNSAGVWWTFSSAKLKPDVSSFFFIPYAQIQDIIVKNYNIFNKDIKKIKIILKNNQKLHMIARLNEKSVPYQTENLKKFVELYQRN